MSKLYFFRHAQASFGAANYDQLSPKGEQQAAILGEYLVQKNICFDKVFVGPLQRQKHTCAIVADIFAKHKVAIPEPISVQGLKEHSGTKAMRALLPVLIKKVPFIKKLHLEVEADPSLKRRNHMLVFQYFIDEWASGRINAEEVEPWADFREITRQGLKTILENTEKGETIAAFTSGGTISSITAEAIHLKEEKRIAAMNFSVRNTSFTTFLYSKKHFNLLSFNELPHLEDDMVTFV